MNYKNGDIICIKLPHLKVIADYNDEEYNNYRFCLNSSLKLLDSGEKFFIDVYTKICIKSAIEIRPASEDEIKTFNFYKECKFISDLQPFDKVLVRNDKKDKWNMNFFSHYVDYVYVCFTGTYKYCVKYSEKTKKLLNTTNEYN